jgi:flagellin-like protein
MLKRIFTKKRYLKNIYKEQKGITGLETAIILIAFVVVAAVFAYTVLSAGLFSTQKSQEAVYSGLQETQNTLVVKGGVLSEALPKAEDNCDVLSFEDDTATDKGVATLESGASLIHEGVGSLKIVSTATATDDILAYKTATVTVAASDTITFWAKTVGAPVKNHIGLALNSAATGTDTGATTKVLISATDDEYHLYSVDVNVADAGAMYIGVYADDAAAGTIYIDDIQVNNVSLWQSTKTWTPYASNIKLTLSLASGGQSIDFSPGNDANGDGVYTALGDTTKTNKMVINYNDNYAHITDVAWTGSFIGNNNTDYMLDPGEKIQLTINLAAINAGTEKVDANHQFTLECKTPKGAILSFQRTMPARLYGIDNLY